MIVSPHWRGRRYAVLGLARSGAATVRALLAGGAFVQAWDSDEGRRAAFAPLPFRGGAGGEADPQAISPVERPHPNPSPEGEGLLEIVPLDDLSGFDALVVSPGVPLNTHPIAGLAAAAGVPVIGDIELFAEARGALPAHKVAGITGTNGKSTTTALVHHILKAAGVPSLMGGNIGLPILEQEPLPEGGVYVLELSSYQIDLTRTLDCDVAVLTNVTPDHLDRYASFEAYAASKIRLFAMQSPGHAAIVDRRSDAAHGVSAAARGTVAFSDDVAVGDQADWPALQGPHNAQNAACAIAACGALGLDAAAIARRLASFPGLPHRMERVATRGGVLFVNDSKATNPDSAAPALAAYPRVHWIVGGRAKGDDLDACAPHFGNVVAAYTIGEAGPRFAEVLKGRVPVIDQAETLDVAVAHAAAAARAGEVVLLSPACASFDQFADYEARGAAFRAAVEGLG